MLRQKNDYKKQEAIWQITAKPDVQHKKPSQRQKGKKSKTTKDQDCSSTTP